MHIEKNILHIEYMNKLLAKYNFVSERDLPEIARQLLQLNARARVFLFEGNLGAGKTTLIKAMCAALGSKDDFSSPTYSIVNEYVNGTGAPIYHMDLYRLNDAQEVAAIGIEEYLFSNNYCFIEWYQKAVSLLPQGCLLVQIVGEDNTREISIFVTS